MNTTPQNPDQAIPMPNSLDGNLSNNEAQSQTPSQSYDPSLLPPEKALELLMQDPVGFIRRIVGSEAETHLAALKEQAELHGAISALRKSHPEFQRFESFILQEAATLLQADDSVAINSWSKILEKAMDNFKQKFTQTLQENHASGSPQNPPYMEGAGNRAAAELPLTFTREQIAKMSLPDFLKNESAINDALKNNRIQ